MVNIEFPAAAPSKALEQVSQTQAAPAPVQSAFAPSAYFDLPGNPSVQSRLPALATAFDAEEMRSRLEAALFDKASLRYTIEDCVPGKAIYLGENICNMRFELEIKDTRTGQVSTSLINGRLFPCLEDCKAYLHDRLMPVAARVQGRSEFAPFATPVAVLDDLNMAISVFPIDGMIPTLVDVTDPQRMIQVFQTTLPEALSGNLVVQDLSVRVAQYGRQQRCVLRYQIGGREPGSETLQQQTVYGKVDADGLGALTVPVIAALRERMSSNGHGPDNRFNVPRSLGFRPDLQLLLMEALPGGPQVARLLKARLAGKEGGPQAGTLTLEETIQACGRMAAALHSTGIKLGRRRTFNDEARWLQGEFLALQQVLPDLGKQLVSCLEEVTAYAETLNPMPVCFSHGDFTYTQLIFNGQETGLVDFDTVCQAEPALDLGQYLAYQRLAILKDQDPTSPMPDAATEQFCELFLDSYIAAAGSRLEDERLLRARVAAYEVISLMRLAVHSWQKLKGNRLKFAMTLLEERVACLGKTN